MSVCVEGIVGIGGIVLKLVVTPSSVAGFVLEVRGYGSCGGEIGFPVGRVGRCSGLWFRAEGDLWRRVCEGAVRSAEPIELVVKLAHELL